MVSEDGRQVVVQLLFCWVLFPGFVLDCAQHSFVVPIYLFLCFVSVFVVHSYSITDTATTWKKSHFLLGRSDIHMINNMSKAFHAFARHMLTLLSVDEMLLLRYLVH